MGPRIENRVTALTSSRALGDNPEPGAAPTATSSSDPRFHRVGDAPVGSAVEVTLRDQVLGLRTAARKVEGTAPNGDGAQRSQSRVFRLLQQIRQLGVQASGKELTDADRVEIETQVAEIRQTIRRLATETRLDAVPLSDATREQIATRPAQALLAQAPLAMGHVSAVA